MLNRRDSRDLNVSVPNHLTAHNLSQLRKCLRDGHLLWEVFPAVALPPVRPL